VQLPLSLTSGPGDADHIYEINATLTGALLLVFNVADGSTLGGGFSAFYTPINAGESLLLSRCRRLGFLPSMPVAVDH
jgi:hypothetical protein